MEFDPQDQDVIGLLKRLKEVDGQYPEHMLVAQRRRLRKHITEIELGLNAVQGFKKAIDHPKHSNPSPIASSALEAVLIVAIIAEAGTVAYFYGDQLADFFRTVITSARVEQGTPPAIPTLQQIQGVNPSPAIASTSPAATRAANAGDSTATPTSTAVPGLAANTNSTPAASQLSSTPVPEEDKEAKENKGHHYGQTPKPERTKENNGKNEKPPKDNEDKPPKNNDDPPSGDKPPKDK